MTKTLKLATGAALAAALTLSLQAQAGEITAYTSLEEDDVMPVALEQGGCSGTGRPASDHGHAEQCLHAADASLRLRPGKLGFGKLEAEIDPDHRFRHPQCVRLPSA